MVVKRWLWLSALCAVLGSQAQAQFIGNVSQQSTASTPFNASTCTAALAAGPVLVQNVGQGAHFAVASASSVTSLTYTIQASYDGILFFDISDVGTGPANGSDTTEISGTGAYPVLAVDVSSCTPGSATFTLKYSGISMAPGAPVGSSLNGQVVKHIVAAGTAGTTFATAALRAPFASASGTLSFSYGVTGPSGSTLQVNCISNVLGSGPIIFGPVTLATTGAVIQTFNVAPFSCPLFTVAYTSGGASSATYSLDYSFALPGLPVPAFQYTHITGTTATVIKGTLGVVHTVAINTGAAGTVSLFDLPAASCTGTPSTNTVAVITAVSGTLQTFTYDANFLNGICLKASAAMDLTVAAE